MNLVAEATNIHGLIVYLVGMILIGGAMTWANYIDDQRDKRRQARAHQHGDDGTTHSNSQRALESEQELSHQLRAAPKIGLQT